MIYMNDNQTATVPVPPQQPEKRYTSDCRKIPSIIGCTLVMSGKKEEVLEASVQHAVAIHGHQDTSELRHLIENALTEE